MNGENPVFDHLQRLLQEMNILLDKGMEHPLHPLEADMVKAQLRELYTKVLNPVATASQQPPSAERPAPAADLDRRVMEPVFVAVEDPKEEAPRDAPTAIPFAVPQSFGTNEMPTAEPPAAPAPTSEKPQPAVATVAPQQESVVGAEPPVAEPAAQTETTDTSALADSLFAPAEPEPEPEEPLPSMMEQIEGNPFGSLFDMDDMGETPKPKKSSKKNASPKSSFDAPQSPATATEPAAEKKQEPSLRDLLNKSQEGTPSLTLGESLSKKSDTENQIENRMMHNKVSDLRTIININDKFSFMTELFHNNMKAYNDFILRLNAISDREEALAHVRMVAQEFQWDKESRAVQTFYSVFDRKF
ncbi:MAG: hypothetical protein IJ620_06485 [Bacteroidales bacterium]|nr:hypothetical protein [Bacteroidales bacterium]